MRVDPHGVGSIMHVMKRGTRGDKIVRDVDDKWQFVRFLYYLNDSNFYVNWKRDTAALDMFGRPTHWPEREPLVDILGWTLLPNHFHLLLQEKTESGIAKFMQRLCNSMTSNFNKKYKEKGSLFQSAYKGKTVEEDTYFEQLVWYVLVKNTLELYPGGISAALKNFDKAWQWGMEYKFSSFGSTFLKEASPVTTDTEGLVARVCDSANFKRDSKNFLSVYKFRSNELKALSLEEW